jgi:hypothetical protein
MTRFVHPLLLLIARFTNKQLAQLIEYLLAENQILRFKLPKRIEVAPAERANLVKLGKPLGSKLKACCLSWNEIFLRSPNCHNPLRIDT